MPPHPYADVADRALWRRSIASGFAPADMCRSERPLITREDRVASAGSCFAANMVPFLEQNGLNYLRTEPRHPALSQIPPELLSYDKFSAAYGNIYTVRQLLQLFRRCLGKFKPIEDRWHLEHGVVDPYRPGMRYYAQSDREFSALNDQHLSAVAEMFRQATVFILTLGLTEAWISASDGAVFPACPGTVAGRFDPTQHLFRNFTVTEVSADLDALISEVRELNPEIRFVLTVSPVPLVATAGRDHVINASTYSKSVLRVAAQQAMEAHPAVDYFPSYEIITGPQTGIDYFDSDRRSVSKLGVTTVMESFLSLCETCSDSTRGQPQGSKQPHTPAARSAALSSRIAEAECEEAMADMSLPIDPGGAVRT